ncbi:VanW family protein [Brevibacillus borstelensis]|uniref:VanW family protein n=1 Tax=Brevibacillus borstelensis TaxID=45462 RepID=UPI0030C1DE7C
MNNRSHSCLLALLAGLVLTIMNVPVASAAGTAEPSTPGQLSPVGAAAVVPGFDRQKLIEQLGVDEEDVVGLYYTSMAGSSESRIHNIKKAVRRINGEKIEPGEEFSYNKEVGNSNLAEEGWKEAHVIVNGQLTDGYGGGICQVSSTLYNAVMEAQLPIVERHSHSKKVGYVPVGQDATVAFGLLDFRFANPYDYTLKIKAKTYDDTDVVIAILKK